MAESDQKSAGLFGSLRTLAETGLALIHNRVELFSVELRQEKFRVVALLIWSGAALFLSIIAILVLTAAIVLMFDPKFRLYVTGALGLIYLLGAIWSFSRLRSCLKKAPMPFSGTITQLKKDREWLKPPR